MSEKRSEERCDFRSVPLTLTRRQGITPKDHSRDNVRAIRELEEQRRMQELENERKAAEAPFKLLEFSDVAPRVMAEV